MSDFQMCYLYYEPAYKDSVKFGDHFVSGVTSIDDAIQHTRDYIREECFGRNKIWFEDDFILKIWDVSEFSKNVGKFKIHAKIDNYLGEKCNLPRIKNSDWFICEDDNRDDFIWTISNYLHKQGQPRLVAALSSIQYMTAINYLELVQDDQRKIVA